MSTAITFEYQGASIRARDDEKVSLTDMWKASGADPSKRPVNWLDSAQAKTLAEFLADSEKVRNSDLLVSAEKGVNGGTWAHWHLALAYAKYLSPAFHVWCNEVIRREMQAPAPASQPVDLVAIVAAVSAAMVPAVRQLLREEAANAAAIGTRSANALLSRIRTLAGLAGAQRGSKLWKSRHRTFCSDLRERCQIQQSGAWAQLPARHLVDLNLALDRIEAGERKSHSPQLALLRTETEKVG